MPFDLGDKMNISHKYELKMHKSLNVEQTQGQFSQEAFDFSYKQNFKNNTYTFLTNLKMKRNILKPYEIKSYLDQIKEIEGETNRFIQFSKEEEKSLASRGIIEELLIQFFTKLNEEFKIFT